MGIVWKAVSDLQISSQRRCRFRLSVSFPQLSTCTRLRSSRTISKYDNSPKNKAFDFILQGGLSSEIIETLSCLTQGSDFIEEQNYTQTHRIVLGLSMMSLKEEMIHHPDQIDAVDALGRSPLIWAAARGNHRHVALLLGAGADPNLMDVQFTSAVSSAAERDHTVCVRLLLEAGADPDPPLPEGIRVGSGLNCAARNATNPLVMKLLLDFGADVEASGVENTTPLIHAAQKDKANFAILLLEYGANIHATTALGQTPLTTAITHNSHKVLQLLLDRWVEYSECPRLQRTHLLQIAATYADIATIEILKRTDHFALNYDRSDIAVDLATLLHKRWDASEKLSLAFEELIHQLINQQPDAGGDSPRSTRSAPLRAPHERMSYPNLMESGLLHCTHGNVRDAGSDPHEEEDSSEQAFNDVHDTL